MNGPTVTVGQHSVAGRKKRNDDSYGILIPVGPLLETKGIAMAIADGMSSSEGAKAASETCVKTFLEDYYATPATWTVQTSVSRVLGAINGWLNKQSETEYLNDRGMVSTFSGVVLKSAIAHVFHAGDSRIYLVRGRTIEQLTSDHRVRVSRQQEYLSRAMGIAPRLEIDYKAVPVEAGDTLIFTVDGVHDYLSAGQILDILAASPHDIPGAAQRIVEVAFANASHDNLTCQVVHIDDCGRIDEAAHLKKLSALPFPPELTPGQTFEGYTILRELHLSKRSQIYLARDEGSGASVVLKTPSVNFEDDLAYLEMFTREEWIGQLVSSPHVATVLRPSRVRRSLYYVTEYIEGQTLRQWMFDNRAPHIETVRQLIEQIAKGLRAFHRKEIIHQDLKPENVMIDRAGNVKIIDFGSARVASVDENTTGLELPALVGTLDYTAPEYHLGLKATNRSDIYALGTIAYELLTGRLPYGRGFARASDVKRLNYIPATNLNPAIPGWVDTALAHAVHKRPEHRTEVLSALVEEMRRPGSNWAENRAKPLLESNPVAFWRTLAIVFFILILLLLYRLPR